MLHHLVKFISILYIIVSEAAFRLIILSDGTVHGDGMGFLKRILGLETKPGEPENLPDEIFDETVREPDMPLFILFFNNWCSGCQVMHGLLNEVGPEYLGRARFYKIDASKSPHAVTVMEIRGVPVLAAFTSGGEADRTTGLMNITELRNWIESHLPETEEAPGQEISETDQDRG